MKRVIVVCILFFTTLAHGQVNLNLGLKAYYPFSGNANDASGNNNNPSFNNATLTADRLGNLNSAYHFNGTSSYIRIPNSPTLNMGNTISLCAWVRPMGFYSGPCHGNSIMMKGDADYLPGNYLMRFDDGPISNHTNCSGTVDIAHQNFYGGDAASASPGYLPYIQSNQWSSVIITYDGTTAKLYVDCQLKVSNPQTITTFTNAYDLFLGTLNAPAFPYWLNGDLDEVRIYDRAINQDEVNVLGSCTTTATCNNWLNTNAANDYFRVGDLDIPGNKVTLEATINRTQPYLPGGGNNTEGDIISKHTDFIDVNYLLRPNHGYVTTTNGFFATPDICDLELNKTYHVAMVYDGATLKFYRNGFLMSQVAATGNLFQNNWNTQIGHYDATVWNTQFLGYINEVRIWNVARTQAQLQTYMNSSLPSPATQTGLQAYYTFDNLLNKQGNTAWNGTLSGTSAINTTNPNCDFIADSCIIRPQVSNIINDYTPVLGLAPCNNGITVEDASHFNIGDTVLLIQMKGALIDTTNTPSFGTILDYKNAGNYEFNYVKNKTGNIIDLKNNLTRPYDIPNGKVQLIRVPYYNNVDITGTLTCLPWDGAKGGVLVFNVKDTTTLNADIDVTGKGFRGGNTYNVGGAILNCFNDNYFLDSSSTVSSRKGEGITTVGADKLNGRGPLANGGGGGNGHNSGGAGGSNIAIGGFGGYQLYECNNSNYDNRGIGGLALTYNNTANKIFLGGGGGGGHKDGLPTETLSSAGGDGGGIIIISSKYLKSNNHSISANGAHGKQCDTDGFPCLHDGMGGGGGAGSILLNIPNYLDTHKENVIGGKGADLTLFTLAAGHVAPGGGGGAGMIWFSNPALPANATVSNTGGVNGVIVLDSNNPFGSIPGSNGSNLFSLAMPIDNTPFKPNIDSVKIKDSLTACRSFDFKGFGFTNTNPIASWNWNFGDAGTANTQNTTHTYAAAGTFTVKLIVTDINGCKDSITKIVNVVACVTAGISNIINEYTPVLAFNPCNNSITVEDASKFNIGDTVLMIQMKGAVIDSTNAASFGTITDYKNSGNYEYNYVKAKTGNIIELKNRLTRQYDIPTGKVQLIRVPYYTSVVVSGSLTCLPWDGSKGGVLVFNVRDSLTMNADMNVSGNGFRGGINGNNLTNTWDCFKADYSYPPGSTLGAPKGEGITTIVNTNGRGALANGGGGGEDHNSGGGGGGNGSNGGNGGYQYEACLNNPFDNGGKAGKVVVGFSLSSMGRAFLGGGGGSGHANNIAGFNPNGANGGGIIIVSTPKLINNNFSIISDGSNATTCTPNAANNNCNEGMGGGGAGGSIFLDIGNYASPVTISAKGGKGADVNYFGAIAPNDPNKHGPGGGGSGGFIWFKQASVPPAQTTNYLTGGLNGKNILYGNDSWGATPGQDGTIGALLTLPIDNVLFTKNIDSVRFKDSSTSCLAFDFDGFGFTNTNPIASWNWYFGDAGTANIQNPSHTYSTAGTYTVKLVVTDINGCKDSITRNVVSNVLSVNAGPDTTFCSGGTVSVQLHGTAGPGTINWTPAAVLDNSSIANPTATINATTTFYFDVNNSALGCSGRDSVTVYISQPPNVSTITDATICQFDTLYLTTTGAATYHWSPGTLVSDSLIASPIFTGTGLAVLIVSGTDAAGCIGKDTVTIDVIPAPIVRSIPDSLICAGQSITLTTSGAITYSWSPATNLDNPNSQNPVFSGPGSQTYYVTGTGATGCKGKDTVAITVNSPNSLLAPPGKSFCLHDSVHLNGNNGNSVQYLWSPSTNLSNTTIIDPVANPPVSTLYSVTITDPACAYDSVFTVFVNVMPLPVINASRANDITCALATSQLTATGGILYVWDNSTSLSNTTIANPVASPTVNSIYTVTGTDNNGCSNKDTVMVLVKSGANAYGIPNSFTPNGDGLNDCFGIKRWGTETTNVYFIIYNRFGEKVFETHDVNICWDGTFKGTPADGGNYVFYVRAKTACGELVKKGNVLLIR